jgi:hypothetical protein
MLAKIRSAGCGALTLIAIATSLSLASVAFAYSSERCIARQAALEDSCANATIFRPAAKKGLRLVQNECHYNGAFCIGVCPGSFQICKFVGPAQCGCVQS